MTIALLNWFLIFIEDATPRDVSPFVVFGQRFLGRTPQLDLVLGALVDVLLRICDQYDAPTANLAATFKFVSSICLEPEIEACTLMHGVAAFRGSSLATLARHWHSHSCYSQNPWVLASSNISKS